MGWLSSLAVALMLAVILIVSLWPMTDWRLPERIANGAKTVASGGLRFEMPGIAYSPAPPAWADSLRSNPEQTLSITLKLRAFRARQKGPARILTISRNPLRRNLTVAQDRQDLILQMRAPRSDLNGEVDQRPIARIRHLFVSDDWHDIKLTISPGRIWLEVAGQIAAEQLLAGSPFRSWDRSYRLALGNELTGRRPWLGEIAQAEVAVGGSLIDYARDGELVRPERYWQAVSPPAWRLFEGTHLQDICNNIALYAPLGLLLGLVGRRWPVWRWIVAMAALSLTMEALQIAIPRRSPTIDDVVSNILGGSLGLGLAAWVQAACRRRNRQMRSGAG